MMTTITSTANTSYTSRSFLLLIFYHIYWRVLNKTFSFLKLALRLSNKKMKKLNRTVNVCLTICNSIIHLSFHPFLCLVKFFFSNIFVLKLMMENWEEKWRKCVCRRFDLIWKRRRNGKISGERFCIIFQWVNKFAWNIF
jgi:hypothetical protein